MQRDLKTGPLRLTVHICKTPEQIGMIFDSLQRCFVLNTSVKSVVINFITRSGGAIPGDVAVKLVIQFWANSVKLLLMAFMCSQRRQLGTLYLLVVQNGTLFKPAYYWV